MFSRRDLISHGCYIYTGQLFSGALKYLKKAAFGNEKTVVLPFLAWAWLAIQCFQCIDFAATCVCLTRYSYAGAGYTIYPLSYL